MTSGAGVLRSASSLEAAASSVGRIAAQIPPAASGAEWAPLRNLTVVAGRLVAAAAAREESRGNHTRTDHPQTDDAFWCRLVST